MKQKTEFKEVGYTTVKLIIDIDNGDEMDTAVFWGNAQLCTVAGEDRQEFLQKMFDLVEEYRI